MAKRFVVGSSFFLHRDFECGNIFFCVSHFFFVGSVRHWWKPIDLNWSLEGNGFNHELSTQHLNIYILFFPSFVWALKAKIRTDWYWQQSTTALKTTSLKWLQRTIQRISPQFASFSTWHIYLFRSIRCEKAFRHNANERLHLLICERIDGECLMTTIV